MKINSFTLSLMMMVASFSQVGLAQKKATPAPNAKATVEAKKEKKKVQVQIKTNQGDILVELDSEKAPLTTKNFLNYVEKKFYDNLVFHRVIDDFMIQGGGFDKNLHLRPTDAPIKNEAANGLKNDKGTVAMARTPNPDSASSQFFINLKDNEFLNYQGPTPDKIGYAVFGKVVSGMDVVEKIGKVKTVANNQMRDVPAEPVIIKEIRKVEKK